MPLYLSPIITFMTSLLAIICLKKLALKIGLIDIPGGRKTHAAPTPLIGGIALFVGLCVGMLSLPISLEAYRSFILSAALIVGIGILDDFHEVSPLTRLLVQCVALFIMIFGGKIVLQTLGNLWGTGPILLHWAQIPVTLIGAATVINAINMLDGTDGLAGGLSLMALMALGFTAGSHEHLSQAWVLGLISSALLAFLCFNFPWRAHSHARIFMGDAGSTLLGLILAWFTIDLSQQPVKPISPVLMLWLIAIPLWDLATVFIFRLKSGHSPFYATADHLYNRLQWLGLSSRTTLFICLSMALLSIALGMAFEGLQLPESFSFCAFLVIFSAYFLGARYCYRFKPKQSVI